MKRKILKFYSSKTGKDIFIVANISIHFVKIQINVCHTTLFQTTEDVRNALCDWFEFECRGTVKVKGKGEMTTYWLKGRKTAKGLPSPRPFIAAESSNFTPTSASSAHTPNATAGEKNSTKFNDKFSTVNESSGASKGKHAPLQQTSSNASQSSTLNTDKPLTKNKSDTSIGSPRVTQSPTSSLTSVPLSPSEIVRAYDQEHAQKIDLQMNMPTPPGSLSRKRHNLESPRDSRNPLKKFGTTSLANCISSQGPPSECSSTYMRVDSPELPAVHFRNVKMGEGDDRHSTAIQNDLFDSLKVGLDMKHGEKSCKGKRKPNNPRAVTDLNNTNDSEPSNRISVSHDVQPPPIPAKNRDSTGHLPPPVHYQAVAPPSVQQNRSSQSQINYNYELGRPIVPYQVSNPIIPHMQKTPLVQAGLTNPILAPIRPAPCQTPKQIQNPSSLFFPNTQAIKNDLASIEEIPPDEKKKRSNMLMELQKKVNSHDQTKIKEKPPISPKCVPGETTYSVINKNSLPGDGHCEEQFVTAVYREPIAGNTTPNKSPAATPPIRSTPIPRNPPKSAQRTTPNSVEIPFAQNDKGRPVTRLPPRPTPPDPRRASEGMQSQRSSTSSQSTITPSTSGNPIVASIDGKTMSLFPGLSQPPAKFADEPNSISLLKRSPSDSSKDRMQNRKSVPQVKRSNSSPKMRPRGLPIRPIEDNPHQVSLLSDDDESVASHQQSENSSVVLLQPIELKLARPAYVRQIQHPDHHINNFIHHDDFVPHMHRHLSRSSDTINSIPIGQRTPKFPLTTAESTSLTQLLQELANDHPSLKIHRNFLAENEDSDGDFDDDLDNGRVKGFSELESFLNGASDYIDENNKANSAIENKNNKHKSKVSGEQERKHSSSSGKSNVENGKQLPNPYQVKRRHNYTMPPRYCRSLDYIPSDREDHVSSNQSSACGSPKSRHNISAIQAYMLPFFSGRNPLGIESISVSSIASSSEMSRSDPALNTMEGGSSAYESEYDNYRPGMTSDEDFFHPDPVSDMDIDIFDDMNVDNVTVSDHYSIDLPPLPVFPKKKITDV